VALGWTFSHNIFTVVTMWASNMGNASMLAYLGVVEGYLF
jgi:hypothetical protein